MDLVEKCRAAMEITDLINPAFLEIYTISITLPFSDIVHGIFFFLFVWIVVYTHILSLEHEMAHFSCYEPP